MTTGAMNRPWERCDHENHEQALEELWPREPRASLERAVTMGAMNRSRESCDHGSHEQALGEL